ncbi:hypothetical protein FQA39_LY07414 [Lamprigera yunnana]|nr:hypothetical protein FQA39_LY07414 [Lamprigera yunnana]
MIFLIILLSQPFHVHLLRVSVYYETLCPDSYDFLRNQFCPTYEKIGSSLDVHFVPYGRAEHMFKDNRWTFACQHGPEECWGNKIQACGIAKAKGENAVAQFVCCVMNHYPQSATTYTLDNCVHLINTTKENVMSCVSSLEGDNLLVAHGKETHSLMPLNFIPTIVFNDKFDETVQASSLTNFYGTVQTHLNDKSGVNLNGGCFFIVWLLVVIQLCA